MNRAQRIVLVIALGIALVAIALTLNLVMTDRYLASGWFAYAPNTGVTFSPSQTDDYFVVVSDRSIMEQGAVWLVAVGTWTLASLWLLRSRSSEGTGAELDAP